MAVVNDLPVWMGLVRQTRAGTSADMNIACATPESYLTRRRVRGRTFTNTDRATIAVALLSDAGVLNGGDGLGFTIDAEPTGDRVDREYVTSDRQTVYDALRELSAENMEWTVDLDWTDPTRTVVRKILRIRRRIGRDAESAVLFESSASSLLESRAGSESTYAFTVDTSDGRYANYVVAYGPGEGEDQPASVPAIDHDALAFGAPVVEHHFQVDGITRISTLNAHARAALARMRRGAEVWAIEARWDAYPRLGVDVMLGDDVSWVLTGHRHPNGVTGSGRMLGWTLDQQAGRWSPQLLDSQGV